MSSRRAGPPERDVAAELAGGAGDDPPGWRPIAAAVVVAALVEPP